jgi:PH/SEC7 domain-containing protein
MSKHQFVRNTLAAIHTQLLPLVPVRQPSFDRNTEETGSVRSMIAADSTDNVAGAPRTKRSDSITSWKSSSRDALQTSSGYSSPATHFSSAPANSSNTSIREQLGHEVKPFRGVSPPVYGKQWESEMESLLKVLALLRYLFGCLSHRCFQKDLYSAIKSQQILQPQGAANGGRSSLSSPSPGHLTRNRSFRGLSANMKRGSIRGLQTILTANGASPYSSNSSVDGRISPSPSFATSANGVRMHDIMLACFFNLP